MNGQLLGGVDRQVDLFWARLYSSQKMILVNAMYEFETNIQNKRERDGKGVMVVHGDGVLIAYCDADVYM